MGVAQEGMEVQEEAARYQFLLIYALP